MQHYDYLIVGCGFFGATFAHLAVKSNKKVLIIDKRNHIGGNAFTEEIDGINIHKYGPHIFHTSNQLVWDYVNQFANFNNFINCPIANYKGELYNLPFNMNTFNKLWGVTTPLEAKCKIESQTNNIDIPKNLEEQAVKLVGTDIFNKLIKGYTAKQWGRPCSELPPSIIKRLPIRYTFDNNYFNDKYQGIPIGGYTKLVEKMISGADLMLGTDYFDFVKNNPDVASKTIYTGMIDEYYNYCFGHLEYRTVRFEQKIENTSNFQGVAVMNFTDYDVPYTRIIEHKHFESVNSKVSVITYEFSEEWFPGKEPYYPINNETNNTKYEKYLKKSLQDPKVIFGGRLGQYKYLNMDETILAAMNLAKQENLFTR